MGLYWTIKSNRAIVLLLHISLLIALGQCSAIKREINQINEINVTNHTETTPIILETTSQRSSNESTSVNTTTIPPNIIKKSSSTTTVFIPITPFPLSRHTNDSNNRLSENIRTETDDNENDTTVNGFTITITTDANVELVTNIIDTTPEINHQQTESTVNNNGETTTEDFNYDLDRFTADYTNTPSNKPSQKDRSSNSIDKELNHETTPSVTAIINITDINDFDQIILTTPSTIFFDEKHKKYEEDHKFDGPHNDNSEDHFSDKSNKAQETIHIDLNTIKDNSTSEHHSQIYYNNAEINSTKYDLSTNEVKSLPENNGSSTTEKRGKYLQTVTENDVNLTIPNTAEVWALASLKNVEQNKTREGAFLNITSVKKTSSMSGPDTNDTIVMKQLADWVEVMKNDVYSNHSFQLNNQSSTENIKNVKLNDTTPVHDSVSAENQIQSLRESNAPNVNQEFPIKNDFNLSAVPVTANKIDIQKPDEEIGSDLDVDIISKNKIKKAGLHPNQTGTHFSRTSANVDIEKNLLPNEDDLNIIKKHSYPDFHSNSTTSTTSRTTISTTNAVTTNQPISHNQTTDQMTTDEQTTFTTLSDHETITATTGTVEFTMPPSFAVKPTTTLPTDITTTDFADLTTLIADPTTIQENVKNITTNTTTSRNDDIVPTKSTTNTTDSNKIVPTTIKTDHQQDISTNIINLNRDEYKYSTVVDDVETTTIKMVTIQRNNHDRTGVSVPEGELETTEESVTTEPGHLGDIGEMPSDGPDVNAIIATAVSVVGVICLILLVAFLLLMRKRQKQMTYGQRCRPVGLDAYSLDNVSVYNSVRRKGILRASKRSYGNAAFDDPTLNNNLLTMAALSTFVENQNAIYEEFKELPTVTARADEVPTGCETKNRYANVVPLPETRVYLKHLNDDDQSEYINANFVRLPKDSTNYYIACQAPLEHTIIDFWRMIWEQCSRVIIMATDLTENGIEKCAEYLPPSIVLDNHVTFGDFQVILKNREVKEKYAVSTIHLKNTATKTWREITHFWYQWPDVGVPTDEATIVAMLLEGRSYLKMAQPDQAETSNGTNGSVASVTENGSAIDKTKSLQRVQGPLTVHCSPGTGRTGTIIACDIALRALEQPTRSVDIPQIVYCVRRGRASAVQTREQYEFIYKVAHMYATKLTGPITEN